MTDDILTPASAALLDELAFMCRCGRRAERAVRARLAVIEAAAAQRERARWTVERVAAAIHEGCEAEWRRRADGGALAITMHFADAHRETAQRVVDAMEADR